MPENTQSLCCFFDLAELAFGSQTSLTASSKSPALQDFYFSWRISYIPHLNVRWQRVGVPDAKCPAVMWSHLVRPFHPEVLIAYAWAIRKRPGQAINIYDPALEYFWRASRVAPDQSLHSADAALELKWLWRLFIPGYIKGDIDSFIGIVKSRFSTFLIFRRIQRP